MVLEQPPLDRQVHVHVTGLDALLAKLVDLPHDLYIVHLRTLRYRSALNAALSSSERSRGCSQAAKWPPRSTSWK